MHCKVTFRLFYHFIQLAIASIAMDPPCPEPVNPYSSGCSSISAAQRRLRVPIEQLLRLPHNHQNLNHQHHHHHHHYHYQIASLNPRMVSSQLHALLNGSSSVVYGSGHGQHAVFNPYVFAHNGTMAVGTEDGGQFSNGPRSPNSHFDLDFDLANNTSAPASSSSSSTQEADQENGQSHRTGPPVWSSDGNDMTDETDVDIDLDLKL